MATGCIKLVSWARHHYKNLLGGRTRQAEIIRSGRCLAGHLWLIVGSCIIGGLEETFIDFRVSIKYGTVLRRARDHVEAALAFHLTTAPSLWPWLVTGTVRCIGTLGI